MALPRLHLKIRFNSAEVYYDAEGLDANGLVQQYVVREVTAGLFKFVIRGMQISYDYFDRTLDNAVVEQLPNGTWTGVVGSLNRSEVDYVPAALLMTEESWDAVAYNYPYAIDEITFMTRKPEYSPETMALFRTLSQNVWSSFLACIILVTLACFVAMKHRCALEDILLHVLSIALNQEGNLVHRRADEVLLLCMWTVAMAVFTFCFKSVLLSFLTFPPLGGVRTVPELAAAIRVGQYIACSDYDKTIARYLQRSPVDDLRVIGESILRNPVGDISDLFDESTKYPIKAVVNRRSLLEVAGGVLYVSNDNMGSLYIATAVIKSFCCKDEMDMLIHRFLAAGIDLKINRFKLNDILSDPDLSFYVPDDENETRKITMTDLEGAFILLMVGQCLSLCMLIIECYVKRRKRRRTSTRMI